MTSDSVWLLNVANPEENLHFMKLAINSQVYSYHLADQDTIVMEEAYRRAVNFSIEVNKVGYWTRQTRLLMTEVPIWERRQNLSGVTFRTASAHVLHSHMI